ncbi:MAG: dephospho-CoA kinase [Alphaproteobacteria bacterium]|nr:dephospho-CoA kinase [Alphaproteobacteria bacterium]
MTFILGLTGSIAMGKSTASGIFLAFGVPVFDADAAVHALFASGGAAVRPVLAAFPGCGDPTRGIDRNALGKAVFDDQDALRRLERIVHPLVRQTQRRFLVKQAAARRPLAVMDIPLLYETGGDALMDAVAVVSAPAFLQAQRVLRRPGMSRQRLDAILARQLPDCLKRKRADFVIRTGLGKRRSIEAIAGVIDEVKHRPASAWPHQWASSIGRGASPP